MKSVAVLALAGTALARSTIHPDVRRPVPVLNADNELHNYYTMPNNQGNIQFNDYTVQRDATDDELWGVDVKVKSEVNNFPHNSGTINISHDDEADNELHKYFSMPGNQGDIQFNDYTVHKDATDDELWGVDVKVHSEVNNFPHNSGTINISHDDEADNELHNYYSMPKNQGNIQFNDYSKTHDDEADNELKGWGVNIGVKSEVNNFPHNSGTINISHDDEADNELHNYYSMPKNQGNIQFNDYTVQKGKGAKDDEADNELKGFNLGVNIGVHSEVNNFPHNSGTINISHDDEADHELHNYYTMPKNQGNIQFNDYTVQRDATDDELWGVGINVKSEVNNFPHNSGTINISHDDEADNELHNYYSMSGNQGNIQFNDYSKTHDDEFVARTPEKLTKDEIEVLAALLKVATQDKDGNVVVDGVKIGKIPKKAEIKKTETPKPKKFLAL